LADESRYETYRNSLLTGTKLATMKQLDIDLKSIAKYALMTDVNKVKYTAKH